jgi:hypothetical protein
MDLLNGTSQVKSQMLNDFVSFQVWVRTGVHSIESAGVACVGRCTGWARVDIFTCDDPPGTKSLRFHLKEN